MHKQLLIVMSALLCIWARPSPADESVRAQMKGLDEQVQEVKTTTRGILREERQARQQENSSHGPAPAGHGPSQHIDDH